MDKFLNRKDAGEKLAGALSAYKNSNSIVLALPRGGVPVGFEVALQLHLPLDVFIVRKLGAPGQEELAVGAIASGDVVVFNEEILKVLNLSKDDLLQIESEEKQELKRREHVYRGASGFPDLTGKTVILVDDGIATGASIKAAILALKKLHPKKLVLAIPVASPDSYQTLTPLVDNFICLMTPKLFMAVGEWYQDFSQTEDQEVIDLLQKAGKLKEKTL